MTTIFFSWQSDRPKSEGRNLIERALEQAIKQLSRDLEIQEAVRDEIKVDSDTKNVPGSPKIFDTILEKIEKAAVVIADVTYVGTRPNGHPTPNPNVLIEFGYALKSIGDRRIILVMNTAYGEPKREDMPFNLLAHRRPITYRIEEGAEEGVRRSQRDLLATALGSALKTFFESDEYQNSLPKPEPISYREPQDGRARFRREGYPIGIRSNPVAQITGAPQETLQFSAGPSRWLRVGPQSPPAKKLKVVDLEARTTSLASLPFYDPGPGTGKVRGEDGCGFYSFAGPKEPAPSLVYVFTDCEIWTINTFFAQLTQDLILLDEGQFVRSLEQCVKFLGGLGVPGPYRWVAGLEAVKNRYLREDEFRRRTGPCLADTIEEKGLISAGDSAEASLESFFEEVFDKCGLRRQQKTAAS